MSGRCLDDLMEQNETELGFLSAYGGGESPEELMHLIEEKSCNEIRLEPVKNGVQLKIDIPNLPLVPSDITRRGFSGGVLTDSGVKVIITDFGPEQQRFIERLVEFIRAGE